MESFNWELTFSLKKILILYPHFPPSNLAGVHRPRLFAQHLPSFGWQPTILTVHEDFYEEKLDHNLVKLLPKDLRIVKVKAKKRIGPIGDIGLRGFTQLYSKAKELIKKEQFDFLYIPIPSFYCALLGRLINMATGIKYGIDYIDPWVHEFAGSTKMLSRAWWATKLANILEPIALKKASLITGVAEGYYLPVIQRNPHLSNVVQGAMPYGGEALDHTLLGELKIDSYLFQKNARKFQLVYAGAMLPKGYTLLEAIFSSIQENKIAFSEVEFHFIGTGKSPNDANGYNIKPLAEKYGLWQNIVFEYPARIPYLDVLVHLEAADAIFILGSTEPHYTPSKTYQAVLSKKPLLAVLHQESLAVGLLQSTKLGEYIFFNGEKEVEKVKLAFLEAFQNFRKYSETYDANQIDFSSFDSYSAKAVTEKLVILLNKVIGA